ncbi:MAG: flippase [archaeon]|nr:flippase [archaeon]
MVQLARKVLKNSIYNSSRVIVSGVGGLIFTFILARLLHPELFGIFHLALAVGFLLLTFADLGINGTVVRYVSYALGKKDETLARSYFMYLGKLKFLLTIISSLSLALLAKPLAFYVFHKPALFLPLEIVAIFLFLWSLLDFIDYTFVALQKFKYPTIRHSIYEGARLALVPLFVFLGFSVYGALVGLCLAVFLALLVLFYFLTKKHPFLLKGDTVRIDRKRILRFLGYLTFGSVAGVVFAYVDSIMLGIFMAVEYVGFYRAGYNIVFTFAGLITITTVLFPVLTQIEGAELGNAFKKVFKYSSLLALPAAFGLIFMAEPIVKVMYGEEYLPAVLPICFLSLLIAAAPMEFFSVLFNAKEKPEYPARLIIVSSVLNVALNYFLILRFGVSGAAIATVISRYFNFIVLGILSKKVLDVSPDLDSVYKPLFSSLIMLGFLYFIPHPTTILLGIGEIIIAAIVYIVIMFLIRGIEKEDIKYLSAIVGQQERLIKAYNLMNSKLGRGGK